MLVDELIQNPLFQGLVLAIVSVLLIPWFTRQWADRQQELVIKNNLVDQISQSVTNIFEDMSFRFPQDASGRQKSFKEWRSRTAVIGAELRTYFGQSTVIDHWNRLYYSTTMTFVLFEGLDRKRSKQHIEELKKYFPKPSDIRWDLLEKRLVENTGQINYEDDDLWHDWNNIYEDLNTLKYELIKRIVKEDISVFSHGISLPKRKEHPEEETKPI